METVVGGTACTIACNADKYMGSVTKTCDAAGTWTLTGSCVQGVYACVFRDVLLFIFCRFRTYTYIHTRTCIHVCTVLLLSFDVCMYGSNYQIV